jgi:16S rRNA (guanine527-N7)-methyltransferase
MSAVIDKTLESLEGPLREGLLTLAFSEAEIERLSPSLLKFLGLLQKWNNAYNLTAVRNPTDMLNLHLLDCLATVAPIARAHGHTPTEVIDVGSGGGLPGIVYALCWPDADIHLIETVGKKVAFLQQCKAQLQLPKLVAHHHRIETFQCPTSTHRRLFTCRAFSSLEDFVRQTWHLRQDNCLWVALKAQSSSAEIDTLNAWAARHAHPFLDSTIQDVFPPGLTQAKRHLVLIEIASKGQR